MKNLKKKIELNLDQDRLDQAVFNLMDELGIQPKENEEDGK